MNVKNIVRQMFIFKSLQMRLKFISRGFRFATANYSKKMSFTESPAKASLCCEESLEGAPSTYAMYEALKDSCQNNATYFQPDDSENGQRLYQGFMTLMDHIDTVWPLVDHVRKVSLPTSTSSYCLCRDPLQ